MKIEFFEANNQVYEKLLDASTIVYSNQGNEQPASLSKDQQKLIFDILKEVDLSTAELRKNLVQKIEADPKIIRVVHLAIALREKIQDDYVAFDLDELSSNPRKLLLELGIHLLQNSLFPNIYYQLQGKISAAIDIGGVRRRFYLASYGVSVCREPNVRKACDQSSQAPTVAWQRRHRLLPQHWKNFCLMLSREFLFQNRNSFFYWESTHLL